MLTVVENTVSKGACNIIKQILALFKPRQFGKTKSEHQEQVLSNSKMSLRIHCNKITGQKFVRGEMTGTAGGKQDLGAPYNSCWHQPL